MPTYNVVKMVHNKSLQQSNNKMTCQYEATLDDLVRVFKQIVNHISWLKRGSTGECLDSTSLKHKAIAKCGDWKLLAEVMKSYTWTYDLNAKDCDLEGS